MLPRAMREATLPPDAIITSCWRYVAAKDMRGARADARADMLLRVTIRCYSTLLMMLRCFFCCARYISMLLY